jgi:3-methyladenine DNA glycosylase AlkD
MHEISKNIIHIFEKNGDPKLAPKLEAYMKQKFIYFGIMTTPRRELIQEYHAPYKSLDKKVQQSIFSDLWSQPHRECHHAAMDLAAKIIKKTDLSWLSFWEKHIVLNQWWDSVDFIAPSCIGPLLINDKNLQNEYAYKWIASDNFWLQRTAIIFQLKYKKKTNFDLLSEMILARADSKEFFIRKACGWSLREYGKTNPLAVSEFINQYRAILSPLTVKEGERRL